MKILFVILFPLMGFAQSLEVSLVKNSFIVSKPVLFTVKSSDTSAIYINVELEKFDVKNKIWELYSSDVFSSNSKPLELTLVVNKESSLDLHFNVGYPTIVDSPKFSKSKNDAIKKQARKGLFRLKVLSGYDEFDKRQVLLSSEFIIK